VPHRCGGHCLGLVRRRVGRVGALFGGSQRGSRGAQQGGRVVQLAGEHFAVLRGWRHHLPQKVKKKVKKTDAQTESHIEPTHNDHTHTQ
jgi:hypothetical protein